MRATAHWAILRYVWPYLKMKRKIIRMGRYISPNIEKNLNPRLRSSNRIGFPWTGGKENKQLVWCAYKIRYCFSLMLTFEIIKFRIFKWVSSFGGKSRIHISQQNGLVILTRLSFPLTEHLFSEAKVSEVETKNGSNI